MSEDLRYPIVMERVLFCSGQCQRHTAQASVIYPDTEHNTCTVCGHKSTIHYDRSVAVIYKEVDQLELEGITNDLNALAGQIINRKFGHLGKKDKDFIARLNLQVLAIRKRVERLKKGNDLR